MPPASLPQSDLIGSTDTSDSSEHLPPRATVQPHRDDLIDELRGVALLGIAVVNAPVIAIASVGFSDASLAGPLDRAVALAAVAFGQSKFYLIFSFLFGYSLPYFIENRGVGPQPVFRRRIAGLAVLGLAHGLFLFSGDILLLYAAVGAVMLLLIGRSDRIVLGAAALSFALWAVALLDRMFAGNAGPEAQLAFQQQMARIDLALATGTFREAVQARLELSPVMQTAAFWFYGLAVLTVFCIGLVAGRRQWLRNPVLRRHWWRRGLIGGLIVGLPGSLLSAWWLVGPGLSFTSPGNRQIEALTLGFVSAPALACAYVCAVAGLHARRPDRLRAFRPAGRVSLSFYLASSLLLASLANGFGFGAMGRYSAATVVGVAVGIWLLLNALAHVWLRHFPRGPVEQLLRVWARAGHRV